MTIIVNFIFVCCVVGMVFSLFMVYRNQWVYRQYVEALHCSNDVSECLREHDRLPKDYDTMMWRWWIWDVEKFKSPAPAGRSENG